MNVRQLYASFRGHVARKVLRTAIRFAGRLVTAPGQVTIDIPGELALIGRVIALEYDTVYDGRTKKARHAFAPGSRPLLAVGSRPGEVFLIGRAYRFTDRGFVDFDAHGRAIEYLEKKRKTVPLRGPI